MSADAAAGRLARGGALITGAARRIGRALALKAQAAGYDVAIHCRVADDDARALADELGTLGGRAGVVEGDLTRDAELETLTARAAEAVGPLTLLVNSASLFEDDRIQTLTPASWDAHMAANLRAPLLLAQAFAAQLPADREGLIVNILDQRVLRPTPQFFSYALSKAALWRATRMMAQALAPRIRVNGVGPGPTLASIHQSPEDFSAEIAGLPLERGAAPEEIADALAYLIDARSVTGQMIAVDGGQHLAWKTPDIIDP
ncbi:MAG TPA: SDR family oxidoreductase [Caulobacteraceae bacterium]|nr:SDR family oxidoreductase [Caulobacteraceae bacterium]